MTQNENKSLEWRAGVPVLTGWDRVRTDELEVKQWVHALGSAIDQIASTTARCDDVQVFSSFELDSVNRIAKIAAKSAHRLRRMLGASTFGESLYGIIVLHFEDQASYYKYMDAYFPEGEQGGSAGVQIREGYPHIALWGKNWHSLDAVLAHEMLHLSVCSHNLPIWLEEGLAQMFEIDMGASDWLSFRSDEIRECQEFWRLEDLNSFWSGEGFHSASDMQKFSYLLAEILVRNLIAKFAKHGWIKRKKTHQFELFVWSASFDDAGEEAAKSILGLTLDDIASDFLGDPK